jgi:hypothetical protein
MSRPSLLSRNLIAAAVASACAVFAARAEEFSWQLSGGTRHVDAGDSNMDSWAIDATYYMKPIADSAGPYALASFLNPTTRVSAAASRSDSLNDVLDDPTAYTVSGAYVLPGAKWYVGAEYAKSNVDNVPPVTISDPKGYGVLAGRYLGANTTLELRLGRSEQKTSLTCLPPAQVCIGFPFEFELNTDSVGIDVFHVRRFRSLTYTLQGSVVERDSDVDVRTPTGPLTPAVTGGPSLRQYSVATELFPTNRLGVRVGYSRPGGDFDVDSYDLAATWFFKPRVAVQFGLSSTSNDDAPPGSGRSESAGVRFIGRL